MRPQSLKTGFTPTLHETIQRLDRFTLLQHDWFIQAVNAHMKGFSIECMGICLHQLHTLLRQGLWIQSQLQTMKEKPGILNDPDLARLLLMPWDTMPVGVPQKELYGAAQKFELIDEGLHKELQDSHLTYTKTLREIFDPDLDHSNNTKKLGDLSQRYMALSNKCIQIIAQKIELLKNEYRRVD